MYIIKTYRSDAFWKIILAYHTFRWLPAVNMDHQAHGFDPPIFDDQIPTFQGESSSLDA